MRQLPKCKLGYYARPRRVALILALASLSCFADPRKPDPSGKFVATAYSVTGITASGEWTHRHVVAADPAILPIGSRIKIRRAGRYSGEYVVADTGTKIVGRKLDIYLPSTAECMKFGKKPVHVKVIELGNGTREAAKQADQAVKKDVADDISKGTVGNAATEKDWANKNGSGKAAAPSSNGGSAAPSSNRPGDSTGPNTPPH
jgi:rare lipoprotein A